MMRSVCCGSTFNNWDFLVKFDKKNDWSSVYVTLDRVLPSSIKFHDLETQCKCAV